LPLEIIKPGTHIDFLGRRRIAFAVSAVLLVGALLATTLLGVRLGIDFAGGTEVVVRFDESVTTEEGALRTVAGACGVRDPSVVRYGETSAAEFLIRFRDIVATPADAETSCPLTPEQRARLEAVNEATGGDADRPETAAVVDALSMALGNAVGPLEIQRVEFVGPRVGDELRRDGLRAIGIACVLILAYIAFRFSARFAPGAVVALVHDVGITAGIFVILGLEFDLSVLAALLAILGYSLNDTIIIYDRIRENMQLRTKHDLIEVLNLSVNQTLSRTLLTSLTTLSAILALLWAGGEVLRPFALAMAIGVRRRQEAPIAGVRARRALGREEGRRQEGALEAQSGRTRLTRALRWARASIPGGPRRSIPPRRPSAPPTGAQGQGSRRAGVRRTRRRSRRHSRSGAFPASPRKYAPAAIPRW
jgi:preprotein translocase subunit SecF